jgi:hypothetical protein
MPRIAHGAIQVMEAMFFVDGHGFLQFGHCFDIDLPVAVIAGEGQAFSDELPSQSFAPGFGGQVHFYQFTGAFRQSRGGKNAAATGYPVIDRAYMIAAAGQLEAAIHIVEGLIIKGGPWLVDAEFDKSVSYDRGYFFVISRLDRPDPDAVHAAKIEKLTQQGDDTI